jgi:hypothetical protein
MLQAARRRLAPASAGSVVDERRMGIPLNYSSCKMHPHPRQCNRAYKL